MPPALRTTVDETDAAGILSWAVEAIDGPLVLTSSFGDPVLLHLVARHAPGTPVVLLDTQYLFPETLAYAERLQRRFGFELEIVRPAPDVVPDELWRTDVDACCRRRKVEPLARALAGRAGWITGIRRVDTANRADAPVVAFDPVRGVTKVNPIVAWTDDDMDAYIRLHDLPLNPLTAQGYESIGCWPCTRPVAPGEDRRAGRWAGSEKTECGLHLS